MAATASGFLDEMTTSPPPGKSRGEYVMSALSRFMTDVPGTSLVAWTKWFTPIAISPRCCSRANEESAPTRASSCLKQAANTISTKAETWSARTLRLPPARFGQLTRDPSIEGGIRRLVLLFQRYRGKLECVKNVAEVELRDCRDRLAIVIHARGRAESG